MIRSRIFLILPALAVTFSAFGQTMGSKSKSAPNGGVFVSDPSSQNSSQRTEQVNWMDGMMLDGSRQDLPFIHETKALSQNTTGFTAYLGNARYVPLSEVDLIALPGIGVLGDEPEIRTILGFERKKPIALIDIYPYRRNPSTGQVERLVDHSVQLVEVKRSGSGGPKSGVYPDNSKMASGNWYRFSVLQDGVYKITYQFLQELGIDMTSMSSDRINVYGNHAGQLPFKNSPFVPTDLLTNAIEVVDGGDGQFGPNDHLLFYATGPQRWDFTSSTGRFKHTKNVYSDSASYFVGIDIEEPKRIGAEAQSTDPITDQVSAFTDRQVIDRDLVNHLKSGRTWYGETYDLTTTYNYSFSLPFLRPSEPLCLEVDVLSRTVGSGTSSQWVLTVGSDQFNFNDSGVSGSYSGQYADSSKRVFCTTYGGGTLPISVTFNKNNPISSVGWMNYLEVNARRDLNMNGDQLGFREPNTVGPDRVSEFSIGQSSLIHRIWDITDPTTAGNVEYTDGGATKTFRLPTDALREFIAFKNSGYLQPVPVGRVDNQNLHATALPADLVIICPVEYQSEAQRLAERRTSEGLSVVMVSPQQVYNEFSSGQRDATAIKRYMRMLYDRAGTDDALLPRYLLLFGDGSYNNISTSGANQNLIPSFQSFNSWLPSACFTTDDYFCLLDDNEGEANGDILDIGVGRLPVSDVVQARDMVTKLLAYDQPVLGQGASTSSCTSGSDGGASDWRNLVLFASDDMTGDGPPTETFHMINSDALANQVLLEAPCLNISKIYMDAYVQVSTPGGQRYPEAQAALQDRVQKGALLVNYVGHGGEVGWAHERFLDNQTILGWTNLERLPLFMTATCEFTRWDDPARTSAGENVLLNPNGGGIGLMTTTRIAYSGANQFLASKFYNFVFEPADELGHATRLGDIYRHTKVAVSGSDSNYRNFCLLGDPSVQLATARNEARITSVTDTLGNPIDTLKALAVVRISGEVTDTSGTLLADFNGVVVPTVFDKSVTVNTLANDGGNPYPFNLRKNIIYRGKVTVQNGSFSFTFVVPKDINYQVGAGRISIYAEDAQRNACGFSTETLVGGTDPNALPDEQGPRIDLYMNDERFVPGGITNEDPLLYAKLFDDNGINTLGNSIGHDLTAIVDANSENAIVLNDVYESDLDTYKSGKVRYRLSDLSEGGHTLDLKAWDVFNNSSLKSLEFVVAPSAELALAHVLNYPNPFTTNTQFFFEHNRPCSNLDVQVQVFTVAGRLVKTLSRQLACDGYRSEPLAWDGLDDQGDKLGRGVYVYRLSVANDEGEAADKVEKLVILR